ncbi:hypothetical protein OG21DRAFT_973438 [Imleria badia]|nr:hypothetical protein OG21DRAFT_973438 [Imleria badia]
MSQQGVINDSLCLFEGPWASPRDKFKCDFLCLSCLRILPSSRHFELSSQHHYASASVPVVSPSSFAATRHVVSCCVLGLSLPVTAEFSASCCRSGACEQLSLCNSLDLVHHRKRAGCNNRRSVTRNENSSFKCSSSTTSFFLLVSVIRGGCIPPSYPAFRFLSFYHLCNCNDAALDR